LIETKNMISSNGLLNFSNSDKCFFENNLLDANDWGKDLNLDLSDINSSPTSSLESDQNICDIDYNQQSWLLDDDIDVWLQEEINPQSIIKQEPPSPENQFIETSSTQPPTLITVDCENQDIKRASPTTNLPTVVKTHLAAVSTVSTATTHQIINSPRVVKPFIKKVTQVKKEASVVKTKDNLKTLLPSIAVSKASINKPILNKNTIIVKHIKPQTLPLASTKILYSTANTKPVFTKTSPQQTTLQPQIVKLENGQYYVAPALPTQNTNLQNIYQQLNNKPCLKRPSDIKTENLFTTAKDFTELKTMKRQQRMMKNRESACLSRQRKKQHLETLEQRVAEISEINNHLKVENQKLKQRIQSLEYENKELREQPMSPFKANAKKTTLLFAIIFLFTLNILRLQSGDSPVAVNRSPSSMLPNAFLHRGRSLLQYNSNNVNNYDSFNPSANNQNDYDILNNEIFNTEENKKKNTLRMKRNMKHVRKYKANPESVVRHEAFSIPPLNPDNDVDCGETFNKTHLTRINKALEGLVKGIHKNNKKKENIKYNLLLKNSTMQLNYHDKCNETESSKSNKAVRKPRNDHVAVPYIKFLRSPEKLKKPLIRPTTVNQPSKNTSQELASLIQKSIIRKPDTFYVVSLLQDMMILPATNYSSTQRPKVTFMLPGYLPNTNDTNFNDGDKLPILQIECNVIDTKLLRMDRSVFSEKLLTQLKASS